MQAHLNTSRLKVLNSHGYASHNVKKTFDRDSSDVVVTQFPAGSLDKKIDITAVGDDKPSERDEILWQAQTTIKNAHSQVKQAKNYDNKPMDDDSRKGFFRNEENSRIRMSDGTSTSGTTIVEFGDGNEAYLANRKIHNAGSPNGIELLGFYEKTAEGDYYGYSCPAETTEVLVSKNGSLTVITNKKAG